VVTLEFGIGGMETGDKLCIILGLKAPVLLRPIGNQYKILGDTYVPGYMNGEAVEGIKAGLSELEDFLLC